MIVTESSADPGLASPCSVPEPPPSLGGDKVIPKRKVG